MMTPWFELQRHARQRQQELADAGQAGRTGRLARVRRHRPVPAGGRWGLRAAYFALWWRCRPRDRAVYLLEDGQHRLGVLHS
ncbi:hypothetical protein ACL02T_34425 [Pseudonocardia sp. RS010]|uniref:hypothetical protein n=1 Tax=Pseudonocardia sp. RS010 TaxID=3385979 RepID=UPI0039A0B229